MKRTGTILLFLLALVAVFPVLFLFCGSFMGNMELKTLLETVLGGADGFVRWRIFPLYPTMRSYVELLMDSPEFFVMFWNSIKLTGGILAGHLLFALPAAWGFAKYDFPCRRFLFTCYMVLMMLPFQVTMPGNYLVLDRLGLLDNQWGIILPAAFSAFPVFLMYRFFCGIPDSLLEAARLDGAGEIRLFFSVGMPLGSSGILSVMVLGFLENWSMIEQPMAFLKTKSLWPLSLYLPEIDMASAGQAFAASVVLLIPALFVFLAGQDYLEQGIISTAVKE